MLVVATTVRVVVAVLAVLDKTEHRVGVEL
jgi:hypothetical protein